MINDEFLLASELNANNMLLLNEGHCFRNSVLKICQTELQQDHRINMESGNFDTLVKLAHRGLGMTLLPYLNTLDLAAKYKKGIKPIAEPTPTREISMLYTRTQLKQEWIQAMAVVIKSTLPEKLLEKSDHIISP